MAYEKTIENVKKGLAQNKEPSPAAKAILKKLGINLMDLLPSGAGVSNGAQYAQNLMNTIKTANPSAPESWIKQVAWGELNKSSTGLGAQELFDARKEVGFEVGGLTPFQMQEMGKDLQLIVTDPLTGLQQFNTDDPEFDKLMNEQYLPLIQQELLADPTQGISLENIDQAMEQANKLFTELHGTVFEEAKKNIEEKYGLLTGEEITGAKEFATEAELKLKREEEDKIRALALNAQNFEEAQLTTREKFRQRGLTFSGIRTEQERKLAEKEAQMKSDIEKEALQKQQDIELQLQSELGIGAEQLGQVGQEGFQPGGKVGTQLKKLGIEKTGELGQLSDIEQQYKYGTTGDILSAVEQGKKFKELFL